MTKQTPVIDFAGNYEESVIQLSKHLGKEKIRRAVFNNIYGRGSKYRSKAQICTALGINPKKAQPVQNALDHLAKYRLITKIKNDGSVRDGSRNLYGKEDSVRGHRPKIVSLADKPSLAARMPTKRRAEVKNVVTVRNITRSALKKKKKLVVLFLTSNPDTSNPLRVDAEVRRVQEAIRGSKFSENVEFHYRPAADLNTILDGLNDHAPQIVHFSGHGDKGGIVTDVGAADSASIDYLEYELLSKALAATDHPPAVLVLNSCWSSYGKKSVLKSIKYLISMKVPISDIAAAAFAPRFYAAIASGQSIASSFQQGRVAVEAASISDASTPELLHGTSDDPIKAVLT